MPRKDPKPANKARSGAAAKAAARGAKGSRRAEKPPKSPTSAAKPKKPRAAKIAAAPKKVFEAQSAALWPVEQSAAARTVSPTLWQRASAPARLAGAAALLMAFGLDGDHAVVASTGVPHWSDAQVAELQRWIDQAPDDGLPRLDTSGLEAAIARGREARVSATATDLAARLAQMHLLGAAKPAERRDWYIEDGDAERPLATELAAALEEDRLNAFFTELKPSHPTYAALREALANEPDPAKRERIARNMERWRWLPQSLGENFVFANAAGFDVALWRGGQERQRWAAISGRPKTPTPAVSAMATAVNFNPWWEVPPSIAKEGGMSARRGFVQAGNRFRQRPGPGNSLGQMKVVMYNPHNIYLHDTPSRGLFGARERAFSHGCIRVADATGFAQMLLGWRKSPEQLKEYLGEDHESKLVALPQQIRVYVTYFTVDTGRNGEVRFHKDIYGHDPAILSISVERPAQLAAR